MSIAQWTCISNPFSDIKIVLDYMDRTRIWTASAGFASGDAFPTILALTGRCIILYLLDRPMFSQPGIPMR